MNILPERNWLLSRGLLVLSLCWCFLTFYLYYCLLYDVGRAGVCYEFVYNYYLSSWIAALSNIWWPCLSLPTTLGWKFTLSEIFDSFSCFSLDFHLVKYCFPSFDLRCVSFLNEICFLYNPYRWVCFLIDSVSLCLWIGQWGLSYGELLLRVIELFLQLHYLPFADFLMFFPSA